MKGREEDKLDMMGPNDHNRIAMIIQDEHEGIKIKYASKEQSERVCINGDLCNKLQSG